MSEIERRLADHGLELPAPAAPVASYAPFVVHNGVITISGQLPFGPDGLITGHLGAGLSTEVGAEVAKACALMILAQAKAACGGDLDRLDRCLKLTGFVASTADFTDHPKVINGASDLMETAMGQAGVHARAAVGVASLPLGAAVEVDAMFSLK